MHPHAAVTASALARLTNPAAPHASVTSHALSCPLTHTLTCLSLSHTPHAPLTHPPHATSLTHPPHAPAATRSVISATRKRGLHTRRAAARRSFAVTRRETYPL
jgi:hypothetical protein